MVVRTEMSPVSQYDEKLQSSALSTINSRRKLYLERLNTSVERKSEIIPSTFGSTVFHSEGLVNSPRGDYLFPSPLKLDSHEKFQKKFGSVTKMRHKMGLVDLSDKKYNSKLKQLLFYFEKIQMKVLGKDNEINISDLFVEIENSTYSIINYMIMQQMNLKAKNQELENKIKQEISSAINQVDSKAKDDLETELQEIKKLKTQLVKDNNEKEFVKNLHSVEIHKLETQNEYLQKELNKFLGMFDAEFLSSIDNLKATSEKKIEDCMKVISEKDTLATRFEIMYAGARKMNENFDKIIKELELKLFESLEKQKYYHELSDQLQEKNNHYYERLMMRTADYEGLLEQHIDAKEQLSTLRERFIEERKNQQNKKDKKTQQNNEIEDTFLKEVEAAEELKKMFASYVGPGKQISLDRVKTKETKETKEGEKEKVPNEIDMKNYMIAKPTYEQLFVGIRQQGIQNNTKITVNMLATIRAIFDCKYNEFLYFNDHKKVSGFPDFVYSWFGKYVFDLEQRKIRGVDMTDPDPDVARVEIINILQTPISRKLWDCITFKEFLDEVHTKDELLYFLHCRNLLFQGPQIANPSSTFTFTYFIRYDWAERVIDHLFITKYDKATLRAIKQKLQERIKKKNNNELIDSGLLLRILLEEYKNHKKTKFSQMKIALSQELHLKFESSKLTFGFSSFKNFLNFYFPEALELEKAELFRKCWIISHGIVDIDSVLTVLNEENYFSKDIKLQTFEGLVPINKQLEINLIEKNNEVYNFIKNTCSQIMINIDPLKAASWEFGVETATIALYQYETRLLSGTWVQKGRLIEKEFYVWLLSFTAHISNLNKVSAHLYFDENLKLIQEWMQKIFPKIQLGLMEGPSAQVSQLREFEINRKVKVLQRFMKTKLSGWYKLMSFLLKTKIQGKLGNSKHII